jgi:hypothetical protein
MSIYMDHHVWCVVISFPTRRDRMLDETSASNSGTHASACVPLRGNSTLGKLHFLSF